MGKLEDLPDDEIKSYIRGLSITPMRPDQVETARVATVVLQAYWLRHIPEFRTALVRMREQLLYGVTTGTGEIFPWP